MNVLIWHVHGSWTTNFVQGSHTYLVPVLPGRGPDGRGRAQTWEWPDNVVEATPTELAERPIDAVVVQRPHEVELARRWTGRAPGRDLRLIWLEHNAPQGSIAEMRHPAADRSDVVLVHVTRTNALFWDAGSTRTEVIEHGVIDPGLRWTGELAAAGVVVNEPVRRGRVVGTDLLGRFAGAMPLDVFGIGVGDLAGLPGLSGVGLYEDLPQQTLHTELARRRCYLHPYRWTSLGLALIEAMLLGMPVVSLATTEVPSAVPPDAALVSNDLDVLAGGLRALFDDRDYAARLGTAARRHALERFALDRFLDQWDRLIQEDSP